MSKVAKKIILLSIQLLGELLVTKSNEISQEKEIQVNPLIIVCVAVCVCVCVSVCLSMYCARVSILH